MKKTFNLHIKFNRLLSDSVSPELLIEFIYKNVYELIDELSNIPKELGETINSNYKFYYSEVIEKSGEEWLETLFPDPELSYYFSFKNFYIGLVGRLIFFSQADIPYFWYGDPMHWNISYAIKWNKSAIILRCCIFILLDNYSEFQVEEEKSSNKNPQYSFIICKTNDYLNNNSLYDNIILYKENINIKELLYSYKKNTKNYTSVHRILWSSYCIKNFSWKIEGLSIAFFYKSRIKNQLIKLIKIK